MSKSYTKYFITQTYSNGSEYIATSMYKDKLSDLLHYFPSDKSTGVITVNKLEITTYNNLEPCVYSSQMTLEGAFKVIEDEIASMKVRMGVTKPASNESDCKVEVDEATGRLVI
jgi:hypothetical protein